jgi:hypothetical protein
VFSEACNSLSYQRKVSILRPVGYGPTTLPLRHSDLDNNVVKQKTYVQNVSRHTMSCHELDEYFADQTLISQMPDALYTVILPLSQL